MSLVDVLTYLLLEIQYLLNLQSAARKSDTRAPYFVTLRAALYDRTYSNQITVHRLATDADIERTFPTENFYFTRIHTNLFVHGNDEGY